MSASAPFVCGGCGFHTTVSSHNTTGCCIFHKKRAFGESSSESESEDEGDSSGGDGQGGGGDKGKQGDSHMRIAQPKHPPVRPWETYHA